MNKEIINTTNSPKRTCFCFRRVAQLFRKKVELHEIPYFCDFLFAILNVDEKYVEYTEICPVRKNNIEKKILHLERSFTYELYHRWSLLLEKHNPLKLMINSEISKFFMSDEEYKVKQPDFVLHENQSSTNNQLLVGEVKSFKYYQFEDKANAIADIIKLLGFLNGQIYINKKSKDMGSSYKFAFFLVYNKKDKQNTESPFFDDKNLIKKINEKIKKQKYKINDDSFHRLFLIEYIPYHINVISLFDVLNSKGDYMTFEKPNIDPR